MRVSPTGNLADACQPLFWMFFFTVWTFILLVLFVVLVGDQNMYYFAVQSREVVVFPDISLLALRKKLFFCFVLKKKKIIFHKILLNCRIISIYQNTEYAGYYLEFKCRMEVYHRIHHHWYNALCSATNYETESS